MSDRGPIVGVDTIAAIATAPGRGAVGILRLSGPRAFAIAAQMVGKLPAPRRAALREFCTHDGLACDSGLVLCFAAPHSYTGEDIVELQGHGGPVVLDLLLQTACGHGARVARPGEFSERAFLNDRLDLAQAEAIADLIEASSREAVIAAKRSLDGEFSRRVDQLAQRLLDLRVFVEGALDFSDEDIDWLSDAQLAAQLSQADDALDQLLREASQGRRLREGMTVAIAGRPNVGKSTLLNALSGADAAIVSDIPGTTRDVLREHLLLNGLPLTVIDTAGLRDTNDPIEAEGIRRAWFALDRADLALFVADDRVGVTEADRALLRRLPSHLPVLTILNKCDLSDHTPGQTEPPEGVEIRLSAATGAGLDVLRDAIRTAAGMTDETGAVFSARTRHLEALGSTREHLGRARQLLNKRQGAELAAEELRLAHNALGEITGRIGTEDLLGAVFSRFCIGK